MYIAREFDAKILDTFRSKQKKGLILAGVVGCGKTTLVKNCLEHLKTTIKVFEYSGDDLHFRTQVASDTKYLFNDISSQTQEQALIFVDEVQKSEAIFDAVKFAFDHGETSFLVTGSNPEYLNTIARKRLQRRADFITLLPFSLPELLLHHGLVKEQMTKAFASLLLDTKKAELPIADITLTPKITELADRYLSVGGLPLAFLATSLESFIEIRKTVERGFEALFLDSRDVSELILVELARIHATEFTYQNIFKKTGLRRRELVNTVISELKNHGYLVAKKPLFFTGAHRSYLSVYSFIDPGIVSYLLGEPDIQDTLGARIEGVIHARLSSIVQQFPLKSEVGYYKPYKLDNDGNVKFFPGEIDFIFRAGKRCIPIEVKSTRHIHSVDVRLLSAILSDYNLSFGIILYGGVPFVDKSKKLIFWPWWGV